jgi:hypothetical protein
MKFNFFKNKLQKKLFLIDSLIASILILIVCKAFGSNSNQKFKSILPNQSPSIVHVIIVP